MSGDLPVPDPSPSPFEEPFWAAAARGAFATVQCQDCASIIWYPRPFCPACSSTSVAWIDLSGRGHIYSFTTARKAMPPFGDAVPYVIAYVELDEGPRILTNIVEAPKVEIGMPVEVTFQQSDHGYWMHRFRPAS